MYIVYLDANNLNEWAMCQPLPIRKVRWAKGGMPTAEDIMKWTVIRKYGYVL